MGGSQSDKCQLIPFQNAQVSSMATARSGSSLTPKTFTKKEILLPQMATQPLAILEVGTGPVAFCHQSGTFFHPQDPTLGVTGQQRIPVTIGGIGPVWIPGSCGPLWILFWDSVIHCRILFQNAEI